jgi:branched-chain amino acid transport system permease protein
VIGILFEGILLGSLYGLAGCGVSLVFGIMAIINIAHAEFIMFGAYITFWLWFLFKINPLLTIIPSMLIVFLLSILMYRVTIRRIVSAEQLVGLILTFALSLFLWNCAQFAFSASFRSVDYSLGSVRFIGSYFPLNKIMSLIIVVIITAGLHGFLKFSRIGKAIRAVSQNPDIASMSGIDIDRIRMYGFGLGGLLGGVAGSLIAIQWSIYPTMGQDLILKCFAIIAIGGIGSLPGSFVGGIILGVAETVGTLYWDATMANIIAPLSILLTYLFRPQGLFGHVERVD